MAEKLHQQVAECRPGPWFCGYGKEILNFAQGAQKYRSQT
jgi:hypothetical protein